MGAPEHAAGRSGIRVELRGKGAATIETGLPVLDRLLERLAEGAGMTLHVRLLNGTDTQHVLEAIFKALGVALAHACESKGAESG